MPHPTWTARQARRDRIGIRATLAFVSLAMLTAIVWTHQRDANYAASVSVEDVP